MNPHVPYSVLFGAVVWSAVLSGAAEPSEWGFVPSMKEGEIPPTHQVLPVRLEPRSNGVLKFEPRWERPCAEALKSNEIYKLTVRARAVGSGAVGSTALKVAVGSPNLIRGKIRPVFKCGPVLSSEWEVFTAFFSLSDTTSTNKLSLFLVHGWGDAVVEVQEVQLESVGADKPLNAYAWKGRWYAGQEPDAAWRAEAEAMIATNRMGTLIVQVIDGQGEPLSEARVVIQQQRHAYRFGAAVNSQLWRWIAPGAESDPQLRGAFENYRRESGRSDISFAQRQSEVRKYFEVLKSDFNYVVLENAMKWEAWSGNWDGFSKTHTFALIDWLHTNGFEVKGHAFVWPSWNHSPDWTEGMADRPEALNRSVHAHITDLGAAMNGKVVAFDVLNEAFNNHDFMDVMGNEAMAGWFEQARHVLPDAQLNVNDFLLMSNGGHWTEKLDFYDQLVERLLSEKAPLEGIGFQSHFRHSFLTGPERIWELCDRFGHHGLPLICSEFDVDLANEALQAAYTRDFLTAWFAHPDTQSFVQWGFWQNSHWLPHAGLYDRDWRMKPNAKAYRDLVRGAWWIDREEARTDDAGQMSLRGFLGDYRVTVYANGREVVLENIKLKKSGTALSIRL